MKKVFDWTVGSFFRTIGRTIAFLVMACLLYYILSYNDISFGIKDLFFERVKAESYTSLVWSHYWRNRTTPLEYNSGKGYYYTTTTNFPVYLFLNDQASQSGGGLNLPSNARRIRFHLRILSYDVSPQLQHIYNSYTIGTYYDKGGLTYCDVVQSTNYNINQLDYTNQLDLTLDCPIVKTSSNLSVIFIRGNDTSSGYPFRIDINPNYTLVYDDASEGIQGVIDQQQQTNEAITNQTQQQQQQHQEMMDNNTTQAESDASNFFGNFTVEDQGGLSAIVTAPLNTIRSLLSSSCTNLVLPLPFVNEDLTLPCLAPIYSEHFGAFFTLYQTIILGIIAYRCIMSIFFDIKGFTNPNDDRIEVMDL